MITNQEFNRQLRQRTFTVSIRIIKVVQALPNNRVGWKIGDQLIRSGTATGALTEEACMGVSYRDFVHGMRMARKEAAETLFWLRLIVAAELIAERADASKPNMGLTSWKGTKVRPTDVTIAKNYLNTQEMEGLNRIVTMYLDYAEDQAKRHKQIFMRHWRQKLDTFLKFNERDILNNAGKVAKEVADNLALEQYERFSAKRLKKEAKVEMLADNAEFKKIEARIKKSSKKQK